MKNLVNSLVANLHILLLVYGGYGLYEQYEQFNTEIASIEAEIPNIQGQIAKNEQKVKEIKDFIKKTDEYKVRVEEVAKTIESVQRQLPAETNDSQIVNFFQDEMKVLNIKDPNITPGAEQKSMYFISRDYNIKASGTFLQFLILIERIGNASRIYNIQTLKLTSSDGAKRGRFQVVNGEATVQAYRYNPEFKVDRTFGTEVK